METLDAIHERQSVRSFDPTFKISEEDELKLIKHTTEAPSSFNLQHWRFVSVKDADLRKKIRAAAYDQEKVEDASLLIILCASLKAWETPEKHWAHMPEAVQKMIIPMIRPFYENNEQLQRDEALRSVGLAAQTLMLAAKSMGFDSCPMIGFNQEKVAKLINLPEDHLIGMMIVIGKTSSPTPVNRNRQAIEEVRFIDSF